MAFKPWCNDCKTWHKAEEGARELSLHGERRLRG
jgi:hypothetical protein